MLESMEVQLKSRDPMLGYCLGAKSVASHLVRRQREIAMFQRIRCPVFLIHGAKDPLIKVENARLVAKALPSWELHILPESGHMPHLEQPVEVAEAINRWSANLLWGAA
jgi:pimeloyl-ACP methyl ester carboxylesterase